MTAPDLDGEISPAPPVCPHTAIVASKTSRWQWQARCERCLVVGPLGDNADGALRGFRRMHRETGGAL